MTPTIERINTHEMNVKLSVDMTLASIPVTITGQYHVHSNCFYPSQVWHDGVGDDLEGYCKNMGWDYYETHDLIQSEVEGR